MLDILLVSATAKEHKDSEIYGVPIHQVGIGKVEAGLNTLQLIKAKKPDIVINFGSCGNLKDYKPGDVKEVKMVYNDFYAGRLYSYPPIKLNTRLDDSYIRCFTTDTFYELGEDYHHSYKFRKDQESIPVYGYKWISDDGVENEWEQSAAIGYDNFKKIFKEQFIDE
jgi:hypothetical protein